MQRCGRQAPSPAGQRTADRAVADEQRRGPLSPWLLPVMMGCFPEPRFTM